MKMRLLVYFVFAFSAVLPSVHGQTGAVNGVISVPGGTPGPAGATAGVAAGTPPSGVAGATQSGVTPTAPGIPVGVGAGGSAPSAATLQSSASGSAAPVGAAGTTPGRAAGIAPGGSLSGNAPAQAGLGGTTPGPATSTLPSGAAGTTPSGVAGITPTNRLPSGDAVPRQPGVGGDVSLVFEHRGGVGATGASDTATASGFAAPSSPEVGAGIDTMADLFEARRGISRSATTLTGPTGSFGGDRPFDTPGDRPFDPPGDRPFE